MGHYSRELNMTSDRFSNFDRVRVDPAQTSFWEGREFRFVKEFSIAQGASLVIKATSVVDVVVFDLHFSVDQGHLRAGRKIGGVEGGVWTPEPTFPANSMLDPGNRRKYNGDYYAQTTVVESGGTYTGGTFLDLVRVKTADNSNFAGTVGDITGSEVGVSPGSRYYVLENLGASTCTGVMYARWEERGE